MIEVKLALYGGMMAMFAELQVVTSHYGENDDAAAEELEEVIKAIKQRALRLNEERSK